MPFTWTVKITVDPLLVADGLDVSNATERIADAVCSIAYDGEIEVKVVDSPSEVAIRRCQGYKGVMKQVALTFEGGEECVLYVLDGAFLEGVDKTPPFSYAARTVIEYAVSEIDPEDYLHFKEEKYVGRENIIAYKDWLMNVAGFDDGKAEEIAVCWESFR